MGPDMSMRLSDFDESSSRERQALLSGIKSSMKRYEWLKSDDGYVIE
jgi:hypothetical protein